MSAGGQPSPDPPRRQMRSRERSAGRRHCIRNCRATDETPRPIPSPNVEQPALGSDLRLSSTLRVPEIAASLSAWYYHCCSSIEEGSVEAWDRLQTLRRERLERTRHGSVPSCGRLSGRYSESPRRRRRGTPSSWSSPGGGKSGFPQRLLKPATRPEEPTVQARS
jgi:hypothetical protein